MSRIDVDVKRVGISPTIVGQSPGDIATIIAHTNAEISTLITAETNADLRAFALCQSGEKRIERSGVARIHQCRESIDKASPQKLELLVGNHVPDALLALGTQVS